MLDAKPALVRVHYRGRDDEPTTFAASLHARQHDDAISLVVNADAWQDTTVCVWQMRWDRITRVEVLYPGYEPSIMEELLAATALSPWERYVYDAIKGAGEIRWRDIPHRLCPTIEPRIVHLIIQALKRKGRITLTPAPITAPALESGVVTAN